MNRIEETLPFKCFRIAKEDFIEFKEAIDNCKYVYLGKDGRHIRPHIVYSNELSDSSNKEKGIIIDITSCGISIKGTYTSNGCMPDIESITTDWRKFITDWIIQKKEDWVIIEDFSEHKGQKIIKFSLKGENKVREGNLIEDKNYWGGFKIEYGSEIYSIMTIKIFK